jgi:hypothetical protein
MGIADFVAKLSAGCLALCAKPDPTALAFVACCQYNMENLEKFIRSTLKVSKNSSKN